VDPYAICAQWPAVVKTIEDQRPEVVDLNAGLQSLQIPANRSSAAKSLGAKGVDGRCELRCPPVCGQRKPTPQKSMTEATAFPQLMKHPGEQRRALSRFACDHQCDFAPIPRQGAAACLFSAAAGYSVRLNAKVGN
jgi:hypothetical protein